MKFLFLIFVLTQFSLVGYAASSDCALEIKKDLCVEVNFLDKITRNKSADFKIIFRDKKSQNIVMPKEKVFAYVWMKMKNGHEHGSDPLQISRMDDHFLVKNVWFLMLGNWDLVIQLREGGKIKNTATRKVCVSKNDSPCD